ncbi:hypothetical protein COLSTE_02194 [Collinsella stercoris DSM 13279]|uniref:Uncharacterized protein n=1 Tax=Collinsella stercoris DSM 13279 TaxID=445975 RepID=B6GDL2_9ACTN|nr:hypothetical protein COLSTE_02194 [Collinsella stercoris DSM 13279]
MLGKEIYGHKAEHEHAQEEQARYPTESRSPITEMFVLQRPHRSLRVYPADVT